MKKGCAAGCLGVVGFLLLLVGAVFWMTSGVVDAADAALQLCGQGKIAEAYAGTSSKFKARTSADEFQKMVVATHLDRFESASWSSRSVNNGDGRVEGNATLKDAAPLHLVVVLSKEGGAWKVDAIYPDNFSPESTPSAEVEPEKK